MVAREKSIIIHTWDILILTFIHAMRNIFATDRNSLRTLDDGDHVLDYSRRVYICSGRDLRLRFRRDRKRTGNAPLGDVAQCGTETWSFRREWIIRLPTIFRSRHETDTNVQGRREAGRESTTDAKRRTRKGEMKNRKSTTALVLSRYITSPSRIYGTMILRVAADSRRSFSKRDVVANTHAHTYIAIIKYYTFWQ